MHITLQPLRVLVVEDDATDFFIICEFIKGIKNRSFIVDQGARYSDVIDLIDKRKYDIYFVDYRLGSKTGLDLIRYAITNNCEEPLILLTGKGNPMIDQEAMEIGAADYLIKSEINSESLERSIRYALSRSATLKALRRSEKNYRTIFERSQETIFVADANLKFKDINQAGSMLFQSEIEMLVQHSLFDFIKNEKAIKKIERELDATGEVIDLEVDIFNGSGESKNCILSIAKVYNDFKEVDFHGIIHDITVWKKAEKASIQAEKLASTWRLARTLAHEVRNPLSTIQMSLEQLEDLEKREDYELFIDIIKRNTHRINSLITELLESSHPGEIQFEKIDLHELLEETLTLVTDRIKLNGIQVTLESTSPDCVINANREKLKLAFLNVLVNAIEAVEPNVGRVDIKITCDEEFYRVTLSDNGCGIPRENIGSLFEPYFTSKKNGIGLGLATTLNIIKAHFGEIEVTSETNKGTVFTITLPVLTKSFVFQSANNPGHE